MTGESNFNRLGREEKSGPRSLGRDHQSRPKSPGRDHMYPSSITAASDFVLHGTSISKL